MSSPTAAPSACGLAAVRISVALNAAGVAAGTSYVPLDYTNSGAAACKLTGFPVVSFGDSAAGGRIGAAGIPDSHLATAMVVLAPGAAAHTWLRIASAFNYPSAQCHPVTVRGIRVALPGQPGDAFLPYTTKTCTGMTGSASRSGILAVEPFRSGPAKRGTAP